MLRRSLQAMDLEDTRNEDASLNEDPPLNEDASGAVASPEVPNAQGDSAGPSRNEKPEVQYIGFINALILSLINVLQPIYDRIKAYHPFVENVMNCIERIIERLEDFFESRTSIRDIKLADLTQLFTSIYNEATSFFTGDNAPVQLATRCWYATHLAILESLKDVERIQEYIIPVIDGVEPLYKIDKDKRYTIRELCFYMNMNFIHRLFLQSCTFLYDALPDFVKPKSKTTAKTVSEQATKGKTTPAKTVSEQAATGKTTPEETVSEQAATGKTTPENTVSEKAATGKTTPENTVSEQAATGKTTPEKTVSEQAATGKTTPEKTVSEQAATGKTTPENTVSEKAATEKTTPEHTVESTGPALIRGEEQDGTKMVELKDMRGVASRSD